MCPGTQGPDLSCEGVESTHIGVRPFKRPIVGDAEGVHGVDTVRDDVQARTVAHHRFLVRDGDVSRSMRRNETLDGALESVGAYVDRFVRNRQSSVPKRGVL
jgi:hypothetical protein